MCNNFCDFVYLGLLGSLILIVSLGVFFFFFVHRHF